VNVPWRFHPNPATAFWAQTNKQTNKHNDHISFEASTLSGIKNIALSNSWRRSSSSIISLFTCDVSHNRLKIYVWHNIYFCRLCHDISPVLRQLHWFPVQQHVNYKIVTLVHRCRFPSYLADDCRLVTDAGVSRLHSAGTRTLVVGRTQSYFGDRTFAVAHDLF